MNLTSSFSAKHNNLSQSIYPKHKNTNQSRSYISNSSYNRTYAYGQASLKSFQQNDISFLTRHHESYKRPENTLNIKYQLYETKPSQKMTQFQKYLNVHSKQGTAYRQKLNSHQDVPRITENPFLRKKLLQNQQDHQNIKQAIDQIVGSFLPEESRVKVTPISLQLIQPPALLRVYWGKLDQNLSFKDDQLSKDSIKKISMKDTEKESKQISFTDPSVNNNEKIKQASFTEPVTRRQPYNLVDQRRNIYKQKARGVDMNEKWSSPQRIKVKGKQFYISNLSPSK